ncbi:MAG TPA: hypothetical protein VGJ48_09670 [Pyrinomonadaceae bacterium]|jgi:hypothetical protein|nr:hypothetical protein [Pyrinomonadaceae bacterium]
MKRTHHLEITRYTRRVTVIQGSDDMLTAPLSYRRLRSPPVSGRSFRPEMQQANAGSLKALESAALQVPRRRSRFSLHDLLRLRKRT